MPWKWCKEPSGDCGSGKLPPVITVKNCFVVGNSCALLTYA